MYVIRKMKPEEAKEVVAVGRRSFSLVEALFVRKPTDAMVAVEDDKIIGAIMIRYITTDDHKIAYIEEAFVDPKYQGKKVGTRLYHETIEYLWRQDCTMQSALVKADNVGSWKLFLDNGYERVTLKEAATHMGWSTLLKHYMITPMCLANGMDFYFANQSKSVRPKQSGTMMQIASFLIINLLLMYLAFLIGRSNILEFIAAYATILVGRIAFSYIGTCFSKRKWHFRLSNGGLLLCAVISLTGLYPLVGDWYPDEYEKSSDFKRALGLTTCIEWIFLIVAAGVGFWFKTEILYFKYLLQIATVFLVYHIILIYPFESFGGRRVYNWNKWLYGVLAVLSVGCLFL